MGTNLAEHCMDFRISTREFMREEFTLGVADELNKCHEYSPRMRAMAKYAFEENLGHHFLEGFIFDLNKEIDEQCAEPEGVVAREAQIEHDCTDKVMLAW